MRCDGLYRNVSEFYSDWDAICYAGTGTFEGGWIAEYEIPFKSLSFDPNNETWGLNFSRSVRARTRTCVGLAQSELEPEHCGAR